MKAVKHVCVRIPSRKRKTEFSVNYPEEVMIITKHNLILKAPKTITRKILNLDFFILKLIYITLL